MLCVPALCGGTSVGHGLVRILFLSLILFPVPAHYVGHDFLRALFLSLILFLGQLHHVILWVCRVFTSRGGGGGSIEPPKNRGGGFGKRAQWTDTFLTKEKVRIHGGNFDFEVAIFDQSF